MSELEIKKRAVHKETRGVEDGSRRESGCQLDVIKIFFYCEYVFKPYFHKFSRIARESFQIFQYLIDSSSPHLLSKL